ncbi:MAG: hypothetical protein Q4C96_11690, partial [Planctomycetia bacterium]|nr:hypothetical protein [Planctomycetia bacterium]
ETAPAETPEPTTENVPAETAEPVTENAPAETTEPAAETAEPATESADCQSDSPFRLVSLQAGQNLPPMSGDNLSNYVPPAAPEPEYIPFEEVQEEIRKTLAEEKAKMQLQTVMKNAHDELVKFQTKLNEYHSAKIRDEKNLLKEEPPVLDFEAFAAKYGMKVVEPPKFYNEFTLQNSPLGTAWELNSGTQLVPYLINTPQEYFPFQAISPEEDTAYVGWKSRQESAKTLSWGDSDLREKVLQAWKLEKARPLAEAEAKKIAAENGNANFLTKYGDALITTGPFTWFTYSQVESESMINQNVMPYLSTVTNIDTPTQKRVNEDFMKTVFSLKGTECGVSSDISKSVFYVVQLKDVFQNDESLRQEFLKVIPQNFYGAYAPQRIQLSRQWIQQMKEKAGYRWMLDREPRSLTSR